MKEYDSYKDSGVEWIGDIPSHWDSSRYRYFYFSNMGVTLLKEDVKEDGIYPVYSATETDVLFGYVDEATIILNEGDIVIPARGNSIGHIKVVTSPSTSTQTTIYSKKISQNIETNFVKYFLQGLREHLFQFDRTAIPQITVNQVKNNPLVIPPISEQTSIASFLDLKTSEIDDIIADKKRLLELYEEEKTAIINQAVTKGIDPDAPMKDSGIEWLGEIPEHWEVKKINWTFENIGSGTTPKADNQLYYYDGNINWLLTGDLNDGEIYDTSKKITQKAIDDYSTLRVYPAESIVMAMYGATIGKLGMLKIETTVNQACCVLSKPIYFDNKFAFYVLLAARPEIINMSYGGGQPNISQELIKSFRVPVPPISEQQSIVNHIESECSKIDFKKARTEELIELLTEYRTALISEAVTGKIKVTED
jgi:type I restriction enzyme S subunit